MKIRDVIETIKFGPHLGSGNTGSIKYLKGAHFDEEIDLTLFSSSYATEETESEKYLLSENDVLLAAKGFRNIAWRYTSDHGPCIPSSLFYVIEVKQEFVSSEYFVLLLNSPKIQHQLKMVSMGVTIPSLPKKELMQIEVELPSHEEQQTAVEINNVMKQQIRIERKILQNKIQLQNGLLDVLTNKRAADK